MNILPCRMNRHPHVHLYICTQRPLTHVCASPTCRLQCGKKRWQTSHALDESTCLSPELIVEFAVVSITGYNWAFQIRENKMEKSITILKVLLTLVLRAPALNFIFQFALTVLVLSTSAKRKLWKLCGKFKRPLNIKWYKQQSF